MLCVRRLVLPLQELKVYSRVVSRVDPRYKAWIHAVLRGTLKMCCVLIGANIHAAGLTMKQAELQALDNDPVIAQIRAQQDSLSEQSVAAYSWPDPKLTLGVSNISSESFDFAQEPMTQGVIGLSQQFPPAGAVGAKRDELGFLSEAMGYAARNQTLLTLLGVRKSWLEVYLQQQSLLLTTQSLSLFDELINITRHQYRVGRGGQQDVIRAQLEQSLLEDRLTDLKARHESAIAELLKWTGARNLDDVATEFPELSKSPEEAQIERNLEQHPSIQSLRSRITAAENAVNYADAQLNPGWQLSLSYGIRDGGRDDLASALISFDLPLFTGRRQSRLVMAREADLAATKLNLDDWRRQMRARLLDGVATYQRLSERVQAYHAAVLPQAEQNTEASLNAYKSGITDFNVLVRARLMQLDSQLQFVKLTVDRAKAQVELLYLAGFNEYEQESLPH